MWTVLNRRFNGSFANKYSKTKMTEKNGPNLDVIRCGWVNNDPLYIAYHDEEWGKPEHNSLRLFEMICLEGQQAGLSWITILKKRENYRKLFHNFNPYKIYKFTDKDVNILLNNAGIVRNKSKINAIINNAKCYIKMENEDEDFSSFIWNFVDNKPIVNSWTGFSEIPSESSISVTLSKALVTRGFKYVGPKICYAFMQACGLVNDHIVSCSCYNK